jgi:hypothetical protein
MTHAERTAHQYNSYKRNERAAKERKTVLLTVAAALFCLVIGYAALVIGAAAYAPCDPTVFADGTAAPCLPN